MVASSFHSLEMDGYKRHTDTHVDELIRRNKVFPKSDRKMWDKRVTRMLKTIAAIPEQQHVVIFLSFYLDIFWYSAFVAVVKNSFYHLRLSL